MTRFCPKCRHPRLELAHEDRTRAGRVEVWRCRECGAEESRPTIVTTIVMLVMGGVFLAAPFTARPAYICGPGPFMAAVTEALAGLGMPDERVHLEVFKSLDSDPFAQVTIEQSDDDGPPAVVTVTLDGATRELSWPRNATLLDVLLSQGMDPPFSCREGHCGACAVLCTAGEVHMDVNDVLEPSDLDEGLILGAIGATPVHLDEIRATVGLPVPRIQAALLTLTLGAVVVEGPAGFYRQASRP
mgnify:CR=1 FL=1